ncbi:BamA/TamA family outer membrane protein [Rheinheimera sp. WS51]|uniref:BamA/TamA family outer membrane protein n=1 Tax=Rheinheimera sp. WS51 TaxID=3425886 RepID=UPI003D8E06EA
MRVALCLILGSVVSSFALADCQPVAENRFLVDSSTIRIKDISYHPNNVFDLNNKNTFWLHEFANYTHTITRESVLADDVLFAIGGPLNEKELAETERLLRSRSYLREAKVRISHYCANDNSVIVAVETWDNWSLLPTVDFSSEGGRSKSALGFEEDNLLGSGNKLSIEYKHETERTGYGFAFNSPNMFGSFWNGSLRYFDNSDGANYQLQLDRPFYRLSSPWSLLFNLQRDSEEVSEYEAGEEVNRFQRQNNLFDVKFGYKLPIAGNNIHRLKLALELNDFNFDFAEQGTYLPLPADRNLSGFWLEYEYIVADYRKLYNINSFNRTEDFNFGWQLNVLLGQYNKGLGADNNALFWKISGQKNWQLASDVWLLSETSWLQRQFEQQQFLFTSHWQLVKHLTDYSSLVTKLHIDKGNNLFRDEPLYIGGEENMRAYPEYFRSGKARIINTVEYRRYTDWSLWQLLDVAFVSYLDVGKVWADKQPQVTNTSSSTLVGVGGGLRLLSSHSSRGAMIHIDITKALTDNENLNGVEFRLMASRSF